MNLIKVMQPESWLLFTPINSHGREALCLEWLWKSFQWPSNPSISWTHSHRRETTVNNIYVRKHLVNAMTLVIGENSHWWETLQMRWTWKSLWTQLSRLYALENWQERLLMSGIHVVQPLPRAPTFINTREFIQSRNPVSVIKDMEPSARNYPF